MDYFKAKDIRKKGLMSMMTERLSSGMGTGAAIGSSISDRTKATFTGIKQRFDPLNVARVVTGGSKFAPALLGALTGRSKRDIGFFTGKKQRDYQGIKSSSVDSGLAVQSLGQIYELLVKIENDRKLELEQKENQQEEIESEENRRNQAIIQALTARKKAKPPKKETKKLDDTNKQIDKQKKITDEFKGAPSAPTVPTAPAPTPTPTPKPTAAPAPAPTPPKPTAAPTPAPPTPKPPPTAPKPTAAPAPKPEAKPPTAAPAPKPEAKPPTAAPTPKPQAKPPTATPAPKPPVIGGGDKPVMEMIKKHEGVRTKPYKDSLGLWTVGVGHLIGDGKSLPPEWDRELTKEEVETLFLKDYEKHKQMAMKTPGWSKANETGQAAMIDLAFNMGGSWYKKFPATSKALEAGDFEKAADNLKDSKWYQQVKSRGVTIVDMIRNGKRTDSTLDANKNTPVPNVGSNIDNMSKENKDLKKSMQQSSVINKSVNNTNVNNETVSDKDPEKEDDTNPLIKKARSK
jgi:GH24 family phage-related lysozyme (muramidase)